MCRTFQTTSRQPLKLKKSDWSLVILLCRDLDQSVPMLSGDTITRPVAHRRAGRPQAPSKRYRAAKSFDERRNLVHDRNTGRKSDIVQVRTARAVRFAYKPSSGSFGILRHMPDDLQTDFSRRFKAALADGNLTPTQLAKRLGIGRTRVNNWQGGRNMPQNELLVSAAETLGVTTDYLLRGRLDAISLPKAIRLMAREMGDDPDAAEFQADAAAMRAARAMARA